MSFSYPAPTNTDKIKTWVAGFLSAISTFLSSIPGTALADNGVLLAKLEKKSAIHKTTLFFSGNFAAGGASIAGLWGGKVPQADGAASTKWKLVSYSLYVRSAGAHKAGNELPLKKGATYGAAVQFGLVSLATIDSQVPVQANFTETAFSTDDCWFIDYTYAAPGGAPTYTDLTLELFWEQNHVAE